MDEAHAIFRKLIIANGGKMEASQQMARQNHLHARRRYLATSFRNCVSLMILNLSENQWPLKGSLRSYMSILSSLHVCFDRTNVFNWTTTTKS